MAGCAREINRFHIRRFSFNDAAQARASAASFARRSMTLGARFFHLPTDATGAQIFAIAVAFMH
jgi:hypothetical protein